jgi:hypothetical protein
LGSFTALAYAWSTLRYIGTGDPGVQALSLGRLKLPDLSFFQNRSGISYRARSSFDLGRVQIPFSVEYVYKGRPAFEFSLGYRLVNTIGNRKGAFHLQAYVSTDLGMGARISNDFKLGNNFFLSLGGSLFHANSLEGERNMGRMVSSLLGVDVWAKTSWIY